MAYTTINKSKTYFNTKLYTGTGSAQSITGVGFQPDFVWGKNRSTTNWHDLEDVVRGATKRLSTNSTDAEATETVNFTAFDSDGFSVGTGANVNGNGNNIVVWNWKAGGTASSNSNGSITSSVSANTTAGFSIVSYAGTGANATVGHGLGSAPDMIIFKSRSNASTNWYVYHSSLGHGTRIVLNTTSASASDTEYMNNTAPTNSVFSLGANGTTNPNGANQIAYCFAEKTGYSKFGSFIGNNNADGTFIYTGFKPTFVIIKNVGGTGDWHMYDTTRGDINGITKRLKGQGNNAETTGDSEIDILSNGIKIRSNNTSVNNSTTSRIYMAFGQTLVGTNNIPATAR